MDVDGLTAAKRPRNRRPWLILATILPLALFVAGAAWFIRTYVAPPTLAIAGQPVLASVEPATPRAAPETTGSAQRNVVLATPPQPEASVFPPPPAPPVSPWPAAAALASTAQPTAIAAPLKPTIAADPPQEAGVPLAGAIPLPPRRPRTSVALARGPVPLPRPRPGN